MAKKSKKSFSGFLIFLIICLATAGLVYGAKHAYGDVVNPNPDIDVVDPTPDNPNPDTELSCVFDRDWFEQISGYEINVIEESPDGSSESTTETITRESISSISFGSQPTGTYLGKLDSGTDVYYTRNKDGSYYLNFVSDKTISAPSNCDNLFSGCSNLTGMNFSNFDTTGVTSSKDMFSGCNSFGSVTGSSNYGLGNLPSSTTSKNDINDAIASETATSLGIDQNNISKISFLQDSDKEYLTTLKSGIVTYYSQIEDGNYELDFVAHKIYAPEDCSWLFSLGMLKSIDFTNFDTSNVTNMSHMFECCTNLNDIDLSRFDTSNVVDMSCMFYECQSLVSLDLSNFNTSNVTDMSCMFGECRNNLVNLDLSNFDTRNVVKYEGMYGGSPLLYTIIVGENYTLDNLYFTVTFYGFAGEILSEQRVFLNHMAEPVEAPQSDGYTFVGWDIDLSTPVTKDISATAIYESNQCEVVFIGFDGGVLKTIQVNRGETINPEDIPEISTIDGYTFVGWLINGEIVMNLEDYVIDVDTTIIQSWEQSIATLRYEYNEKPGGYVVTGFSNGIIPETLDIPSTYDDGINGTADVVWIDDDAFYMCDELTSVTMPDSIIYIGSNAFYDCFNLETITLSNSLDEICSQTFFNCYNLRNIIIPDSVGWINFNAFGRCTDLQSITLSNNLTHISEYAFRHCQSLTSVTIPANVSYICEHAFDGCTSLKSVTFENTKGWTLNDSEDVDVSDGSANAYNLTSKYIDSTWQRVDLVDYTKYLKFAYDTTTSGYFVTAIIDDLPNGQLIIPSTYDDGENGTADVVGITSFGDGGYTTNLTSVTIPASVVTIKSGVFANCTNLESVVFENTENWKVTKNMLTKTSVDVTDSAKNVEYLKDTYSEYSWLVSKSSSSLPLL